MNVNNSKTYKSILKTSATWFITLVIFYWLSLRSRPVLLRPETKSTLMNTVVSSELISLSERLCCVWTSTRDIILRKFNLPLNYRYGLEFQIKHKNLHLLMCILLAGDIATNPGPFNNNATLFETLHCLSFNAQSLRSMKRLEDGSVLSNLRSFQDFVYAENLDIVAVTETWFNCNVSDNEVLPSGYKLVRKDRPSDKRGGGVLLALRDGLEYNRIASDVWSDRLEIIAVELESQNVLTHTRHFVFLCDSPNCDLNDWLNLFTSFLQVADNYEKILITGDFNFPDLTWNSDLIRTLTTSSSSNDFQELVYDFYLQQMNMHPTRARNILDLILTNSPESIADVSCLSPKSVDLSSDHNLLLFDFNVHTKLSSRDSRTVFDYSQANWESLYKDLTDTFNNLQDNNVSADSNSTSLIDDDIDQEWQNWSDRFLEIVSRHIPTKVLRRRRSPPWFDNETRHMLKKKETARRKAKKSGRLCHLEKYRALRHSSKALIKRKRNAFFQSLPGLMKSNTKKFWSVFKYVSNISNVPSTMNWSRDETTVTADNPHDIANLLNNYFYSMFKPTLSQEEYDNYIAKTMTFNETINDIVITPNEVRVGLLSLDTSKACGPDNIPAALLKYCAPYISSSLCNLFNKSLKLGRMPAAWKISNIVPIPKSGPVKDVTNYRPISLLCIVSKVLERCIYNRLIDHISTHLHHLQFGFLRGKSTTSQLLRVLHEIGELLDKRVQTDVVYLDFAKAFDRVDHQLLLKKLSNFGVSGNLLEWFQSYLKDINRNAESLK